MNKLWECVPHSSHKLPYSVKKARKSYLKLAKSKKWTQAKCRKVIGEQLRYIELASGQLQKYASMVPDREKLFPRWLRDRLSVVDGYTFLEQTSWSNFNEGCDLKAAVEDYKRKFGCYPSAVPRTKSIKPAPTSSFVPNVGSACPARPLAA